MNDRYILAPSNGSIPSHNPANVDEEPDATADDDTSPTRIVMNKNSKVSKCWHSDNIMVVWLLSAVPFLLSNPK